MKRAMDGGMALTVLTGIVVLVTSIILVNNFGYKATFFGNVEIRKNLTAPVATFTDAEVDNLVVNTSMQIPVDSTPGSVTDGALQYSTTTNSLQVFKSSDGWVEVGGKIPIAETNTTFVESVDSPDISLLRSTYTGANIAVTSEATFNSAVAGASAGDTISFANDITFTAATSITKRLRINLNGFTMFLPVQTTYSLLVNVGLLDVLIEGGTIRYTPGSAPGSSATLISCISGSQVYIHNCILRYGEFCIGTGSTTLTTTLYVGDSQLIYEGNAILGQSASNSFRTISVSGMSTRQSYVYVNNCNVISEGQGGTETQRLIFCLNQPTTSGSIVVTGCTINPAHRLQALVFYEATTNNVRTDHRLFIDSNTIGNAGLRNQLALIFQGTRQSLNSFDSLWFIENTVERVDDDKGLFYIDTEFSTGSGGSQAKAGSADVYIFNNTYPALPAPGATRKVISKDGFVRGYVGISSCYLQKYSML